jgi:threonine dehydrogenase-like Zn-dependent dehydrogenase
VPVPESFTPSTAGQVEPCAVAHHGVARTPIGPDDLVVVQGCGPIGLVAVQLARAAGAGRVVAVEPGEHRRELAARLGADDVVEPGDAALALVRDHTAGMGADVVLECAGSGPALDAAVTLARTGGWVSMIGVSSVPVTVTPGLWLVREITVAASMAHTRHDFEAVIALLGSGALDVEPVHSSTIALDELDDAMADLADARSGLLKVLVDPSR